MRTRLLLSAARVAALLFMVTMPATAAIPPAWITVSRNFSDGSIYMWNSSTKQIFRVYQKRAWDAPNPSHCAFSPDGRRVAFILKGSADDGVYTVNNDGTDLQRICGTFSSSTGQGFCNINWTQRGLFWTENTREVYWADPVTKQSRSLGTITANTTGNMLRMSRDGSRAYLRTNHDIGDLVGGLFFETNAGLTGILNQRILGSGLWDHGSVMLNDGSKCLWVIWHCGSFGNPPGCAYHKMFASIDFVNPTQYTTFTPNDGHGSGWELDGPGWGPFTTPSSNEHILYNRYGTGSNEGHIFFIMNVNTNEVVEVTPTQVAAGGPISSLNPGLDVLGEFWFGDLPSPHTTTPSIALSASTLLFSDQSLPIAPDTITVTNAGAGTLTTVTVAKSPSSAWLTTTLLGSGNTQRIRVAPSSTGLVSGTYICTLTVSGGGATNSRTCVVTLSVGAQILAPSGLSATHNAGAIDLAWTDNSSNETGFTVQRMPQGGAFALLATLGANVISYRDTSAVRGQVYQYRVRAALNSTNSTWSNTATASVPLPPITLIAPAGGESFTSGQQMRIRWQSVVVQTIMIEITYDGQENWSPVTSTGGISQGSADWGDFAWTIPAIVGESARAQIKIGEYPSGSTASISGEFTIVSSSSVSGNASASFAARPFTVTQRGETVRFSVPETLRGGFVVSVHDLCGRRVARLEVSAGIGEISWVPGKAAPRSLVAQVYAGDGSGVVHTQAFGVR